MTLLDFINTIYTLLFKLEVLKYRCNYTEKRENCDWYQNCAITFSIRSRWFSVKCTNQRLSSFRYRIENTYAFLGPISFQPSSRVHARSSEVVKIFQIVHASITQDFRQTIIFLYLKHRNFRRFHKECVKKFYINIAINEPNSHICLSPTYTCKYLIRNNR